MGARIVDSSGGLDITVRESPEGSVLHFNGCVDERARFGTVPVPGPNLIFDLGGVALINSLGIRGWVNWMREMRDKSFTFRRCSKAIVDQINVLEGFLPPTSFVESFFVPYHCDACGGGEQILFRHGEEFEKGTADRSGRVSPPTGAECPKCRARMEMDVIESKYFRFIRYRR